MYHLLILLLIIVNTLGDESDGKTVGVEISGYHNYTALVQELDTLVSSYPHISRRYNVGTSVRGRDLAVLQIAGGVARERPKLRPMVKLIANMHGNEAVGREVLLAFSRYLVENYERNSRISSLIDNIDLHILPSLNPDGFENSNLSIPDVCDAHHLGSGRHNANGVDLNRAFPTWNHENLSRNQLKENREPEVISMINWILENPFLLSANLHDGAVVANYPWDDSKGEEGEESKTGDDATFRALAQLYANSHATMHQGAGLCHDDNFPGGITNGAKWYIVEGGMQDFNYIFSNCMELTLELSCCKYPSPQDLQNLWEENREALLKYVEVGLGGVRGMVRDQSGQGVAAALVTVEGIDKSMTSSSRGEYWRILAPGLYRIMAEKDGRISGWSDFEIKSLTSRDPVVLDLVLVGAEPSPRSWAPEFLPSSLCVVFAIVLANL
ncbi:carboxypeptidase D isoform X1 [Eurytemora carolleeae]|uniref:carboxypeptidase D isoform X1 n=1 Tax=Eurytemora carolleeae TaxID=1294199 RepID=UPI000C764CAA|nr:carboxypeptidase D isoform X1 [Eurytemora carolleeae]|eukprot:XP_023343169.1 carboxypeptidase D-like isoform X1 [Eurytemora affinis]